GSTEGVVGVGTATSAIAMRVRDLPHSAGVLPGLGEVPSEGQPVDPDALLVFFASEAQSCSEPVITVPWDAPCQGGNMWQMVVAVPPGKVAPGLVELSDPETLTYQAAIHVGGGDCASFGAGASTGWPGALELLSLDSTSLSVKLNGVVVGAPFFPTVID